MVFLGVDLNFAHLYIDEFTMKSLQQGYKNKRGYIYYAQIYNPGQSANQQDIQVQYQIQSVLSHRFKQGSSNYLTPQQIQLLQKPLREVPDEELQYLVKWVGHDQNSWQPGQNLKNAPQILESYKLFYSENKDMSSVKSPSGKTRGRKPKNSIANSEKSRTSKRRNFNFGRIYKESENLKICEDEEDDLEIIDKDTYIKGIRELPIHEPQYHIKTTKCQEQKNEQNGRLKKKAEKIDREANSFEIDLNQYNIQSNLRQQEKYSQQIKEKRIFHQDNKQTPINKQQTTIQVEAVPHQLHLPQPFQEIRERSVMITQQQKYVDEESLTKKDRQKEKKQVENEFSSPTQQLISLFVSKRQKEKTVKPVDNIQPQPYEPAFSFKYNLSPLAQPEFGRQMDLQAMDRVVDRELEQVEVEKTAKRYLNSISPVQFKDQLLNKKIKPNEDQKQKKPVVTINIIDDQPIDQVVNIHNNRPLRQTIQKQVSNILQDNIHIEQILKDSDYSSMVRPVESPKVIVNPRQGGCLSCKRNEEYNNQLKFLFNELLQSSQQINLDNLFLQQQTFSILSSLNPNAYLHVSPSGFLRMDKMADISENSSLRLLISRKIATVNDIQEIVKHFTLQKLIKMGDQWVAIFKVTNLAEKKQHFKYVLANELLRLQRQLLVNFLKK